jgi:uncharacterized protein YjbI with pentapeptide repeats
LVSMLMERIDLDAAGGLKTHMLIEEEVYKRSMDRHRRVVSGGEEFVFRYCSFEDVEPSDPHIASTFIRCGFERCEWEDASFNGAIFVGAEFNSCRFSGVSFANSLFVECAFVNCAFREGPLGESCSFEDSRWHACAKDNTTGLEVVP